MNAVQRSLFCFRSAITWAAIALLLLNDHVLKAAAPSWLSGKLSDFAGLFFFPFLVALLLGLPLDRLNVRPRTIGRLAFALTALWFTLIKTVPLANHAAEALWTPLYGRPAAVALDPTDLIALVALWPAWRLWNKRYIHRGVRWPLVFQPRILLPLTLAVLATSATSYGPDDVIRRIVVHEGTLYARGTDFGSSYLSPYAEYRPDEDRWVEAAGLSEEVRALLDLQPELPVVACHSTEQVCYRVVADRRVHGSLDAGRTWETAWEFPLTRVDFVERMRPGASAPESMGPFDVAILETAGGLSYVAVALGSEGALMRYPNGEWRHHAVLRAEPTLTVARSYRQVTFATADESIAWLFLTLLYLIGSFTLAWKRPKAPIIATLTAAAAMISIGLPTIVMGAEFPSGSTGFVEISIVVLPLASAVLGMVWDSWRESLSDGRAAAKAGWTRFARGIGTYLVGGLPFVLWAIGYIDEYEAARWLAIIVSAAIMIAVTRWTLRLMAAARQEPGLPEIGTNLQ